MLWSLTKYTPPIKKSNPSHRAWMRSNRCSNNNQIFRCSGAFGDFFFFKLAEAEKNIGNMLRRQRKRSFLFYGSLRRPEYEQISPLNEQRRWRRSEPTSRSEMEPSLFVFDPGKMRRTKKGVYTEADTNQGMHLHLEMRNTGKQIQQVPTLEPRQREIRQTFQSGTPSHNYIDCTTL